MWCVLQIFVAVLLIQNSVGEGGHEDDVHVIQLGSDNFDSEIKELNYFVMFFAPWCGHCQRLAPTWEQLAELLNTEEGTRVKIGKVDCTVDHELCSTHGVTGYPTLKFFKLDEPESIRFRGTRDLASLSNFINEQLGKEATEEGGDDDLEVPKPVQSLYELTDETFAKHVQHGKHFIKFYAPWCGHCQRLAPTWEELAKTYETETSVTIAKIDCTQYRPVCQDFEVKGYPTLLWIEDGKKIEKYAGSRSHEDLKIYVDKMSGAAPAAEDNEIKSDEEENVKDAEADGSLALQYSGLNFENGIKKGVSFVKFFAPWCGHCKRLAPTWDELAAKFNGQPDVQIAKVDCTLAENKELCSAQEVDGFPTLFVYKDGEKVAEYNGNRSMDDLYDFVNKHKGGDHDEL